MRTDLSIKEDILDELEWQPSIDETQIGVVVKDGIVTLTGTVDSYVKKREAEKAAKSVVGVKAVAEEIEVKYNTTFQKSDSEIAAAAVNALKWNISVPSNKIEVKVEDGWVYLGGDVMWDFEKNAAKKAVENLQSVKYVVNNIALKNAVRAEDIKDKIKKAFERSADIDAKDITVKAEGHNIKLTGTVHSLKEKDDARRTAFYAPGVWSVDNELVVEY
ncbi:MULTISPECIES: BON domain-containing protein [Olleya]|uniref:Osmotically-inducible protein OsmY, contains BON domain n=1 Tax=Olleya namhaensis TaxID=1144750 RepID=A0A1I3KWB2_9FLAO|nr:MULTISPECIES: BON domain-containing protein [Olleya]PKG49777.1 BON domain-containing protein [Olleya sp. 1-3]SFI76694.1 Osmotically-inducible protein OsmY, contains BON domain [Olleya namhaensis]